jgi:hypothetical protein
MCYVGLGPLGALKLIKKMEGLGNTMGTIKRSRSPPKCVLVVEFPSKANLHKREVLLRNAIQLTSQGKKCTRHECLLVAVQARRIRKAQTRWRPRIGTHHDDPKDDETKNVPAKM